MNTLSCCENTFVFIEAARTLKCHTQHIDLERSLEQLVSFERYNPRCWQLHPARAG